MGASTREPVPNAFPRWPRATPLEYTRKLWMKAALGVGMSKGIRGLDRLHRDSRRAARRELE